ncbi:MAG: histidine phosphatase family protein [Candidatus Omnitrophica bacterium]|nr:histidine phosphatase family protein [Candidatus Omnitrophota bacterium]
MKIIAPGVAGPVTGSSKLLYIVRHGESASNNENRIQGHSDSGLTARGMRQAAKAGQALKGKGIRRILSSDLGRALSTARVIGRSCGLSVRPDPLLREIRLGKWEGLTPDEVNHRFANGYHRWLASPSTMHIPGAERVNAFHRRVRGRVLAILAEPGPGPVLLVTHGGVIASLLAWWLKADFDTVILNLRVDNTSITAVEESATRVKIHRLAQTAHLSPRDLGTKNIFSSRR